jgi:uridine kinase
MIIAIGGISNAGKSRLAARIADYYKNQSTIILCQDNYANPTPQIPKIDGHTNWEIPESIDFDRYYQKIIDSKFHYDIIIAEGLFVYYDDRLNDLYDKCIYMTIDKDTFMERKKEDFRWGKEPEWYMEHIWGSHFNYCNEVISRRNAFQLSGRAPVNFESVIQYLES